MISALGVPLELGLSRVETITNWPTPRTLTCSFHSLLLSISDSFGISA